MTDLRFNLIKSVGSRGNGKNNFCNPQGVFYHDDVLYVADADNKRVKLLNPTLEYLNCFSLNFEPRLIKIIDKIACVRENSAYSSDIYFYDIDSFILKEKYNNTHGSRISNLGLTFYAYDNETNKFYCYDKNGHYLDEIKCVKLKNKITNHYEDGLLIYYNNDLIVSMCGEKNVFKINL